MCDVVIEDGWLPYVPLSWHRRARYERDEGGAIVRDPRTRQPKFLGLSETWRGWPVGWIDHDEAGRVWVLA